MASCLVLVARARSPAMPRLIDPDPPLPDIVSMRQALRAGLTPDQVRHRLRSRRWTRISRGMYRTRPVDETADHWQAQRSDHAARAIAEIAAWPGSLVGFESAAVLHELPLWRPPAAEVMLIAGPGGHNGRRPGVIVHRLELDQRDVCDSPVPITSVPRTWFDVTRNGRLSDGLVLGDAALRAGLMAREDVARLLGSALSRRGVRVAKEAAGHLDPRRETPLESASWAYFVRHRLPLPSMQIEIRSRDGRFVARVDFLWAKARLVGEADGRLKYADPDALYAEKRREDDIRAEGYRVIRWGIVDLRTDALAAQLRRVLTWLPQAECM